MATHTLAIVLLDKEMCKILERHGWQFARIKGSHPSTASRVTQPSLAKMAGMNSGACANGILQPAAQRRGNGQRLTGRFSPTSETRENPRKQGVFALPGVLPKRPKTCRNAGFG